VDRTRWANKKGRVNPTFPSISINRASTSVVTIQRCYFMLCGLDRLKAVCRHLARTLVGNELIGDLLAVLEVAHASALNSRDVNENVCSAVIRLNEAEALGCVEPLNGTCAHDEIPFKIARSRKRIGPNRGAMKTDFGGSSPVEAQTAATSSSSQIDAERSLYAAIVFAARQ